MPIQVNLRPRALQFQRALLSCVLGFLIALLAAAVHTPTASADTPPYPPSPVIAELTWAPASTIQRAAHDSDNFPMTWGDDDYQYTAYGDGYGFEPYVSTKLSLGLARVSGPPEDFQGENIRSETGEQAYGGGSSGKKASGLLMVDGVLYMWVRNADNNGHQCQLALSADHAQTWSWSDWKFAEFGYCTFINYGKNYAGAPDEYVYMVSHSNSSAYQPGDGFILTRVPKTQIMERSAYEFFVETDPSGNPVWSTNIDDRGFVFEHPDNARRSSITYNAALGRYLWWQGLPNGNERFSGGFGVYDAPTPWGPWTTVYYTDEWDVGPGDTATFPSKWMSADGKTLYLVFSGDDYFSVRKATLTLHDSGDGDGDNDGDGGDDEDVDNPTEPVDITDLHQVAAASVAAGADDAEEKPNGTVELTSDDLDMTLNGGDAQTVGVRFQGVDVPRGATIRRAYIEFTPQEESAGSASFLIEGEAAGDAATFTTDSHNISERPRTEASVAWDNVPNWEPDSQYRTPQLTAVVQVIVGRADWQAGNAMAFIITGEGDRTAEAHDSQPAAAPRLHIEYIHSVYLPLNMTAQ